MPYTVTRSNGVDTIAIADAAFNTDTSIPLLGQNVTNYGENVATAFVHMLEHFANSAEPSNPLQGQVWFDTDSSADGELKVNVTGGTGAAAWRRVVQYNSSGNVVPIAHNTYDLGSNLVRWANAYAVAFQAGGADLAERYEADTEYSEGTVVKIGGEKEITATTGELDSDVFGVISLEPGLALNTSAGNGDTHPFVAVAGRVKVRVIGQVSKGQRLVTSMIPGVAMAADIENLSPFTVIGRALEDKTTEDEGLVLSVVGSR
jgi:hypothetical protein